MANSEYISLNFGPHASTTIGPMRFKAITDGEVILKAEPEVGYLHRGIEKVAERMQWAGVMPYLDKVDYLAGMHCAHAYALAVESLARIEVSPRINHIRIMVSELNRIASHLFSLGHIANLLGSSTVQMYTLRDREKISTLFETLCGARLTYHYIRIGGVAADITEGFIDKTHEFLEYLLPKLREYEDLISNNYIYLGRMKGMGVVSAATATNCGLTGPALRASGVALDVRKTAPYSGYGDYHFEVPVGKNGDALDRVRVRLQEIAQSMAILKQGLNILPKGPVQITQPRIFKPPKGEAYSVVESPRGAFGVYICSSGEKSPARVKFRTPSFAVLNLFPELLKNTWISDVPTIISSFDISASEVDR